MYYIISRITNLTYLKIRGASETCLRNFGKVMFIEQKIMVITLFSFRVGVVY